MWSEHLLASVLAFYFSCFSSFCPLWTLIGSPALLGFCLLNFRTHILQDLRNLLFHDLAASPLQPGVRSFSSMFHVYAYIALLSPVLSGRSGLGPASSRLPERRWSSPLTGISSKDPKGKQTHKDIFQVPQTTIL